MSRIVYFTPEISTKYGRDPNGEWMLEEEIPTHWESALQELDLLKSGKIKHFIKDTLSGDINWKFQWVSVESSNTVFETFITVPGKFAYRMTKLPQSEPFGFAIRIEGNNGFRYNSKIDDSEYPQVGMELFHLAEDLCTNRDYMIVERERLFYAPSLN